MAITVDRDNLYPESGSHHVSNGRWLPPGREEFYSPSQPRGKDGKWRLSGSGSVSPSPIAQSVRASYLSGAGLTASGTDYSAIRVPVNLRARTARAYEQMDSHDPSAVRAYRTLMAEIDDQYRAMVASGIRVEVVDYDPYPDVAAMIQDVNNNKTIKVLATKLTGEHPVFGVAGNDIFRAVHDFYGHAATGRDFGRHGERATYIAHADTMKSNDSIRALFSETEAQNAYLIANKEFGPQKIGLLPDDMVFNGVQKRPESVTASGRSSREQLRRRSSSKSIRGRDPSLRWPHLYDILRAKGYDKEKAARISNSRLRYRKKGRLEGLPWKKADNKRELRKLLKASALTAACYEASCRPPTSGGTGGSRGKALSIASLAKAATKGRHAAGNTSAYPVDTLKATRANDKNPVAPGHADRSAVRGHKGVHGTDPERRIPHQGETVDIYRDLGHGKAHKRGFPDDMAFSVRHASAMPGEQTGLVVASTTGVILNNGRPSWAHSAKAQAEVAGKRGVHGFIRGEVQEYVNPEKLSAMVRDDPSWKKVTYYPGTQDFFDPVTRNRFVGSDQVALVNGEFFAKNPQFVSGNPTPVSPIERKLGLVSSASAVVFACYSIAGGGSSSPKA